MDEVKAGVHVMLDAGEKITPEVAHRELFLLGRVPAAGLPRTKSSCSRASN
jgi:hypothetical protein